MRFADILGLSLAALWQQKVRTFLTVAGVSIGSFALAVCLSLGEGFHAEVDRQMRHGDQLRQVWVYPNTQVREKDVPPASLIVAGTMSDAKRQRLRQAIIRRWPRGKIKVPPVLVTEQRVAELRALPHVEAVTPVVYETCDATLGDRDKQVVASVAPRNDEELTARLVAGQYLPDDDDRSVLVGEYLLYQWGIESDEQVAQVVGRKLRVVYPPRRSVAAPLRGLLALAEGVLSPEESQVVEKVLRQMRSTPDALDLSVKEKTTLDALLEKCLGTTKATGRPAFDEELTIAGVLREYTDDDESFGLQFAARTRNVDLFLSARTAERLFRHGPQLADSGFDGAVVTVDDEDHMKEVVDRIKETGLREFSLLEFAERVRATLKLSTFLTSFLAGVSVLAAALGITNTLFMSVLERTREIGVMKAVGARDRHIHLIFLVEGALLGVLGGGLGVLACWLVSFPGDSIARDLLESHSLLTRTRGTLFVFPWWLVLGVPFFAGVVTTLAAVLPARRAARVNPIAALRHE